MGGGGGGVLVCLLVNRKCRVELPAVGNHCVPVRADATTSQAYPWESHYSEDCTYYRP